MQLNTTKGKGAAPTPSSCRVTHSDTEAKASPASRWTDQWFAAGLHTRSVQGVPPAKVLMKVGSDAGTWALQLIPMQGRPEDPWPPELGSVAEMPEATHLPSAAGQTCWVACVQGCGCPWVRQDAAPGPSAPSPPSEGSHSGQPFSPLRPVPGDPGACLWVEAAS